jgi:hypothetical protein
MTGATTPCSLNVSQVTLSDSECATASTCKKHLFATVPTHDNPYDPTSTPLGGIRELVPWDVDSGFDIPTSGTTTKYVSAGRIDLSGLVSQNQSYYQCAIDPGGGCTTPFVATAAPGFLGRVFLCQDGADVLSVEMFTFVLDPLDWLTSHSGSQDTCNIIVVYSQFDNYIDEVASLGTGVLVSVGQGGLGDYGHVTGAVLIDPALGL